MSKFGLMAMAALALSSVAVEASAARADRADGYADAITVDETTKEIRVAEVARDHIQGEGLVAILNQAASLPAVDEDGDQAGYVLYEIDPGSVFETIGIFDGDLVTHVDGVLLENPRIAVNALHAVRKADTFTFTVRRASCRHVDPLNGPAGCRGRFGPPEVYVVRVL